MFKIGKYLMINGVKEKFLYPRRQTIFCFNIQENMDGNVFDRLIDARIGSSFLQKCFLSKYISHTRSNLVSLRVVC